MKYPPYPRYKPSGVEWLGDVPEHWTLPPLYTRYSVDLGKMLNEGAISGNWLLPYLRNVDVQWDHVAHLDLPEMDIRPHERARYTVRQGDLLVCEGGEIGRAAIVPSSAAGLAYQKALHRLRPAHGGQVPRYLLYTLLWASEQGMLVAEGNPNTIDHLTGERLRRYRFPNPPADEQSAIAAFLDCRAAKLGALVSKKRVLIELLKEKRAALISRVVTRGLPPDAARAAGLDPHPRTKPSGVEWLGDVPEHWEVARIKHVARIESGHTPSRSVEDYWVDCGIPWISLNDSKFLRGHDSISDTAVMINERGLANSSARVLPAGAVVFSRDATVGLCAITTRPMAVSQHFVAYLCGSRLLPRYLLLALKAMGQHLERLSLGATIPTIGMDDIRSLACVLPPLPEQRAIADYLDRETAKIDRLVAKIEAAVERLLEYRSALVAAAVTGRIDVREATL